MSLTEFTRGQQVIITEPYNHFKSCNDTIYQIAQISRIAGLNSVQLLHNSVCVGAIPESKLKAAK